MYFDGCPNWQVARENLRDALAGLGWAPSFETVLVETEDQARSLRFTGSPTIMLDGKDIFGAGSAPAALACRVYRTGAGLAGSPTREDIVIALERAMDFPTRWDPFFKARMTLADVYAYPVLHFDFHARQLDLQSGRLGP